MDLDGKGNTTRTPFASVLRQGNEAVVFFLCPTVTTWAVFTGNTINCRHHDTSHQALPAAFRWRPIIPQHLDRVSPPLPRSRRCSPQPSRLTLQVTLRCRPLPHFLTFREFSLGKRAPPRSRAGRTLPLITITSLTQSGNSLEWYSRRNIFIVPGGRLSTRWSGTFTIPSDAQSVSFSRGVAIQSSLTSRTTPSRGTTGRRVQ